MLWGALEPRYLDFTNESLPYITEAKALASGQFNQIFLQWDTQPVYPLILAAILKSVPQISDTSLTDTLKTLNLWFYLGSILLVHWYVRNQIRKPYSLIITTLYALAPVTLIHSLHISPDMTYILLSIAALWSVDMIIGKNGENVTTEKLVWCCFWVLLAALTHFAGYFLLAAFATLLFKALDLKRAIVAAGTLLVLTAPWLFTQFFQPQLTQADRSPMQWLDPPKQHSGSLLEFTQQRTQQLATDTTQQTIGTLNLSFLGSQQQAQQFHFNQVDWLRWLVAGLVLTGLFFGAWNHSGISSLYLGFYLLSTFFQTPSMNFYTPVLPLLFLALYYGLMRIGELLKELHIPASKIMGPALTVLILACTATTYLSQLGLGPITLPQAEIPAIKMAQVPRPPKIQPEPKRPPIQPPEAVAQHEEISVRMARWIQMNTPHNAVIAAQTPQQLPRLERKLEALPQTDSPELLLEKLFRYDFLIEQGGMKALSQTLQRYHPHFRLVYQDPTQQVRVWQIRQPSSL